MKKKLILLAVFILLTVSALNGCAAPAEDDGWEEKLKTADGVISVEKIEEFDSFSVYREVSGDL